MKTGNCEQNFGSSCLVFSFNGLLFFIELHYRILFNSRRLKDNLDAFILSIAYLSVERKYFFNQKIIDRDFLL